MSAEDGTKSIREMASDGNCLFRSISDQLLGDYGEQHSHVRRKLCDFLETKEDEFIHFLFLGEEEDADAETFEDYVTMMREDGEWGGNLELVIASQYYRYVYLIILFFYNMQTSSLSNSDPTKIGFLILCHSCVYVCDTQYYDILVLVAPWILI
jgi:hypothetical protein